jgi:secreted PhoX family phosphatase
MTSPSSPSQSRRRFLQSTAAVTAGFGGLYWYCQRPPSTTVKGYLYGPLDHDKNMIIDLPKGFRYTVLSRHGDLMDDGIPVPGLPDGMGAFPGRNGTTILVRNHELAPGQENEAFQRHILSLPKSKVYDWGSGKVPALGGTTTLVVDRSNKKVLKQYVSLVGTIRNCAGGVTPWGTWVSCEETVVRAVGGLEEDHGYCFEVPALARGPIDPVPLKAMGRFNHEAIAVDPGSGAVYLTEDRFDSLIYRYLPDQAGKLHEGGRLQALVISDHPGMDTRNWSETSLPIGEKMAVRWVDLDNVEAPDDDLRLRGHSEHGAAIFARGEGIFQGNDSIYWVCTNGGASKSGQVFRYYPSAVEGRTEEASDPGQLELFVEPNDSELLDHGDNLCIAPWGDLIVCEDGLGANYLVGIKEDGEVYRFGKVHSGNAEFAGSVFSADGTTLFVNIQNQGLTLAITGPWKLPKRRWRWLT